MLCYVVEYVVPSVLKDHMAFNFFVLLHQEDKGHYDALKHQNLLTQYNSVMSHGT
jgi:hypothetical protein